MSSQTSGRRSSVNLKLHYAMVVLIILSIFAISSDTVRSATLHALQPGDIVVSGRSGIHVIPSGTITPLNLLNGGMHGVAVDSEGLIIAVGDDVGRHVGSSTRRPLHATACHAFDCRSRVRLGPPSRATGPSRNRADLSASQRTQATTDTRWPTVASLQTKMEDRTNLRVVRKLPTTRRAI